MKISMLPGRCLLPVLILAAGCAGCAVTDEGATDFRLVQTGGTVRKDFLPSEASNTIKPGEPLAVTLKQAFIRNFTEIFSNPLIEGAGPNGEIAIVANVFEDDGTQTVDYGPSGLENARVVFFSDDVWKGQFLNFHDIPLYGPLTYQGHALVLDLYIVEIDDTGEQMRQLVSNLAQIGKTFYPPSSPVAGPLAKLAGTFIGDQQDDRAFHFTLYQRPPGGNEGIRYSVIDAGYLVFVRVENRRKETEWTNIVLNQKLAKLMYKSTNELIGQNKDCDQYRDSVEVPDACLYRENTYMVVEVNTAPTALRQDRQQMLYSTLQTALSGQNPPVFSQDPQELQEALGALANDMAQGERAGGASAALAKVENTDRSMAVRLAASENFAAIWFAKAADGTPVAFPADDANRLLERVSRQLATCGASADELSSLMTNVRNRDPGTQNAAQKKLVAGLVCDGS